MDPKNLIIIMSDEHDPRFMGNTGHPRVKTPNLDKLAARGTSFSAAYTDSPICVPARASFATGRYVHDNRHWDNALPWDGEIKGWTHRLQSEGLYNATIGKLHYSGSDAPFGIDSQIEPMHVMDGIGMVWGSIRDPLPVTNEQFKMLKQIGPGESGYNRFDMRIGEQACTWLREAARKEYSKPWVLYVGFVAPHFPLVAPEQYFEPYPLEDIPFPKLHPRDGYTRHPWVEEHAQFTKTDQQFDSDEQRILAIAAYHALCTFLDDQIGSILDVMNEIGMNETARLIYTSDHGDNVGARGLWGKSVLYEEATRIPMILSGPDIEAGKICTTPCMLIDIYQTVLDGVDLSPNSEEQELPGQSLFALAAAPNDPDRLAFSQYHAVGSNSGGFMLRRGQYKYHYYVGHRPELFDLEADPEETHDLWDSQDHQIILADFQSRLRAICDPEAVDRAAKADQEALLAKFGGRDGALGVGTAGATPAPGAGPE